MTFCLLREDRAWKLYQKCPVSNTHSYKRTFSRNNNKKSLEADIKRNDFLTEVCSIDCVKLRYQ